MKEYKKLLLLFFLRISEVIKNDKRNILQKKQNAYKGR